MLWKHAQRAWLIVWPCLRFGLYCLCVHTLDYFVCTYAGLFCLCVHTLDYFVCVYIRWTILCVCSLRCHTDWVTWRAWWRRSPSAACYKRCPASSVPCWRNETTGRHPRPTSSLKESTSWYAGIAVLMDLSSGIPCPFTLDILLPLRVSNLISKVFFFFKWKKKHLVVGWGQGS